MEHLVGRFSLSFLSIFVPKGE